MIAEKAGSTFIHFDSIHSANDPSVELVPDTIIVVSPTYW